MADQEHATRKPMIVAGTVIGLVIAALFTWLFAALGSLSVTTGVVILTFLLLGAWTIAGAVMYGPADEGAEAH